MSGKWLIVQFVHFAPSAGLTDFRLCEVSGDTVSDGYPTLQRLVVATERARKMDNVVAKLGYKPWHQKASGLPEAIAQKCVIVRAVVWTFGSAGLKHHVPESYANCNPIEDKYQPDASFWLLDPVAKHVLERHVRLKDAIKAHGDILRRMKIMV